ncbi:esterase-like activity of phytase family protein [Calothrix rhizosoleniae]|uniref:esterase-like activity of phytase family protein n=1 Tax=Calothrix rhizosoleniae TaxID=888997 RepID=UPI000B49A462|nr:esterase-like activity of phytase family protein [Calothrix rhizosoleniae]
MNKLWTVKLILHLQSILFSSFLLTSHVLGAELVGRAILSADTFAPGSTSGQFKQTNRTVPFIQAQPVQGFSAVISGPKPGTYLVISDNGFGAKSNSYDYLLRIYGVEPDFVTGTVFPVDVQTGERLSSFNHRSFVELNDRHRRLQWPIVGDGHFYPNSQIPVNKNMRANRLLTGGDFDIESFQRISDGSYWIGDEFGPFLLNFGANGELLTVPIALPNFLNFGKLNFVKSPEHPTLENLSNRTSRVAAANLGSSRGFEGMAINASGSKLYVMLEGALKDDPQKKRLLIHEFDLDRKNYTGQVFSYKLENQDYAIGELTAINDREFLVIERDHRQGYPLNQEFRTPAKFKRIYKIDISRIDKNGFVAKELLVDLLNISDPKCISGNGKKNCQFTFPFVTIESVLPIDAQTLLVINDNNYADSMGRKPKRIDNTEFITIRISKPLLLETPGKSQ